MCIRDRHTGRARTKVGLSDPVVPHGRAIAQRIKANPVSYTHLDVYKRQIERYEVEKGFEFSSFATPTIGGEIKKYFRDKVWTLRVPRRVQELSKKVSEAKVILEQKNKKHPKVKDCLLYTSRCV